MSKGIFAGETSSLKNLSQNVKVPEAKSNNEQASPARVEQSTRKEKGKKRPWWKRKLDNFNTSLLIELINLFDKALDDLTVLRGIIANLEEPDRSKRTMLTSLTDKENEKALLHFLRLKSVMWENDFHNLPKGDPKSVKRLLEWDSIPSLIHPVQAANLKEPNPRLVPEALGHLIPAIDNLNTDADVNQFCDEQSKSVYFSGIKDTTKSTEERNMLLQRADSIARRDMGPLLKLPVNDSIDHIEVIHDQMVAAKDIAGRINISEEERSDLKKKFAPVLEIFIAYFHKNANNPVMADKAAEYLVKAYNIKKSLYGPKEEKKTTEKSTVPKINAKDTSHMPVSGNDNNVKETPGVQQQLNTAAQTSGSEKESTGSENKEKLSFEEQATLRAYINNPTSGMLSEEEKAWAKQYLLEKNKEQPLGEELVSEEHTNGQPIVVEN